jgi:hypothetical protein
VRKKLTLSDSAMNYIDEGAGNCETSVTYQLPLQPCGIGGGQQLDVTNGAVRRSFDDRVGFLVGEG